MFKNTVKIIALALCIALSFSLISCEKDREYDPAEVTAAAKTLVEKSVLLNEIYYGKGIPADELSSEGSQKYKPANFIWLDQNDFETVKELKQMTSKVYTSGYCESIFSSAFGSAMGTDDNIELYARYIQVYEADGETPRHILVDIYAEPLFTSTNEYLYDTAVATHSKGERVFVNMDVKVTSEEGKVQTRTLTIALVEEGSEWLLDGPTFLYYFSPD